MRCPERIVACNLFNFNQNHSMSKLRALVQTQFLARTWWPPAPGPVLTGRAATQPTTGQTKTEILWKFMNLEMMLGLQNIETGLVLCRAPTIPALGWDDESCNTLVHPRRVVRCMTSYIRYDWCWDERFVSTVLETHGGRIIDDAVIGPSPFCTVATLGNASWDHSE